MVKKVYHELVFQYLENQRRNNFKIVKSAVSAKVIKKPWLEYVFYTKFCIPSALLEYKTVKIKFFVIHDT